MTRTNLTFVAADRPSNGRTSSDTARKPLREFAMAFLMSPVTVDDGRILPAGSRGAIVFVYEDGAAYEVEFSEPFEAVVTVEAEYLSEAEPA